MIGVDQFIEEEKCDDLILVLGGIGTLMERADAGEVRALTELARYIVEGVEANVYLPGYSCDYREDFVVLFEEWSERLITASRVAGRLAPAPSP